MAVTTESIANRIFNMNEHNDVLFERVAIELFQWHAKKNETYRSFIGHLGVKSENVSRVSDIPFLPITLFKRNTVGVFNAPPEAIFLSSGTTGTERSQHHVADLSVYEHSLHKCFHQFFGKRKITAFWRCFPPIWSVQTHLWFI